jgi:hypothetical protein
MGVLNIFLSQRDSAMLRDLDGLEQVCTRQDNYSLSKNKS